MLLPDLGVVDVRGRRQFMREAHRFLSEHEYEPGTDAYSCALVLLASTLVGPSEKRVQRLTGLSTTFVRLVARRLRRNRLWLPYGIRMSDWTDPRTADLFFGRDVSVGLGLVEIDPGQLGDGQPFFGLTDEAARAQGLLRDDNE